MTFSKRLFDDDMHSLISFVKLSLFFSQKP